MFKKKIIYNLFTIDVKFKILGRISSLISTYLIGKYKYTYLNYLKNNDIFIIINSDKLILSGKKNKNKIYYHHTGYPGGIKKKKIFNFKKKNKYKILLYSIYKMLPKNKLRNKLIKKIKIYENNKYLYLYKNSKKLII